jgi:hypothetical protein
MHVLKLDPRAMPLAPNHRQYALEGLKAAPPPTKEPPPTCGDCQRMLGERIPGALRRAVPVESPDRRMIGPH